MENPKLICLLAIFRELFNGENKLVGVWALDRIKANYIQLNLK